MIYDAPVNNSEVYAPVQTNIFIRSASNNKNVSPSTSTPKPETRNFTSESSQRIDISKFTQKLQGITARSSSQKCAKSIRLALEKAGAHFQNHPVAAADWGSTLMQIGYHQINHAFDQPEKGDIYIIQRTKSHPYGHIAAYTGSQWVSDFKQSGYAVYKNENVNYSYFRMGN